MQPASLSRELVDGFLSIGDTDLPDTVISSVTTRILDTLGSALSAVAVGEGTAASKAMIRRSNSGASSFWGSGGSKGRAAEVAFANGMLCHAMDYDDTHTGAVVHPSGIVLPAALAVGEETGASGMQTLAAAAIGYESAIRLGLGAPGVFQTRGFQGSAILGPFAAALVTGKLKGASSEIVANAWGVAGSMASGINEFHSDGSGAKQIHLGWAAHNGVTAMELALEGATGPATVLEGRDGVFENFAGTAVDRDSVVKGLGNTFLIAEVASKPYPACHCVHPVIDSWLELAAANDLGSDLSQIDRIVCLIPEWYVGIILEPQAKKLNPPTTYARRFSLPYCLGRAVIDGEFGLDSFAGPVTPELRQIMGLIGYETVEFEEFPQYFPGGVRVEMRDGRSFEQVLRHHRGSDQSPPSFEETTSKIVEAGQLIGSERAAQALIDAVVGLPDAQDLGVLGEALSGFRAPDLNVR